MAYFHFYLNYITGNWTEVFLKIRVHEIPKAFDMDVGIVNEYWSESIITWNNRPSDITWAVDSLNFTIDGYYLFNFTKHVPKTATEFSFMFYDQHTEDAVNVLICTSDHVISEYRPQLIFYYPSSDSPNTGNSVVGYPIVLVGLISLVSIIFFIYRIRVKKLYF